MDYHFLKRFLLSVGTGFIVFVPVVLGAVRSSENYQILSDTFVSGGGYSSSDNYQLQDIVGEGVVNSATSTSANFGVKSGFFETFGETLTFSLGASSLELGQLDAAVTKTGSHTMSAATDIDNGFNINVSGSTLSSGANIIDAMGYDGFLLPKDLDVDVFPLNFSSVAILFSVVRLGIKLSFIFDYSKGTIKELYG